LISLIFRWSAGFYILQQLLTFTAAILLAGVFSNTLDAECSLNVFKQAINEYGKPEIINSDQGSQFTCPLWTEYLEKQGITISMDGRGRALDNIYIERFWRTIKQEYIYIWPAEDGNTLVRGIKEYMNYYNNQRTHQSLDRLTPFEWYEFAA